MSSKTWKFQPHVKAILLIGGAAIIITGFDQIIGLLS